MNLPLSIYQRLIAGYYARYHDAYYPRIIIYSLTFSDLRTWKIGARRLAISTTLSMDSARL